MKRLNSIVFLLIFCSVPFTIKAQRLTISLDGDWSFCVDSLKNGMNEKWFGKGLPSEKVQSVHVPHTWNIKKETSRYWGWGWYQQTITVPADWKGKNIKLQFNAVYHDATIWINGVKAGEHKGSGYTKFFIDATKLLVAGKKNTLTVLADNSFSPENIPFMKSFDWPNDGGIIRSVSMLATGRPHIDFVHVLAKPDLKDLAHPKGSADIKINVSETGSIDLKKVKFELTITEDNQKTRNVIYKGVPDYRISGNTLECTLNFDSVNLWHFDNPNLYKIELTARYKDKITDNYSVSVGFREFKTNGYKLELNGEPLRTAGVEVMFGSSLKNGMAETKEELEGYLQKLQYLNCIYTRFHWQQDDYVLDWCNRNGVMVQAEIPIWGGKTKMNDTIISLAKQHLHEMITDQYNNPCIVSCGVGNEIAAREPGNIAGVKELYRYTKQLDDSRLVNYVSNSLQQARHWMPEGILPDASAEGDVLMFNDYHTTWYRQAHAGMGAVLDTIKVENRVMPLMISEFGLCEPENWGDDEKRFSDIIYYYAVYESKPYIAGVIYFCVNDYRTHMGGGLSGFHTTRVHGVYDLNGAAKPSASILRQKNCPIEVSGLNRDKENLIDITLVASLGFPSYTLKGFKIYWSENTTGYKSRGEEQLIPDLAPGKLHHLKMQNKYNNKGVLTIENPRGKVVFQKIINTVSAYF